MAWKLVPGSFFHNNVLKKRMGSKTKMKLDFLSIFDNLLSKHLIHRRVLECIDSSY